MSTSTQHVRKVLLSGLDAQSVAARFPEVKADDLAKELAASEARMKAVANLDTAVCWLFLEDEHPADRIAAALKADTYDAVLIGWGVRGMPENTPLLEEAIAAIRKNASIETKVIFSTTPTDHLETIARHFPEIKY